MLSARRRTYAMIACMSLLLGACSSGEESVGAGTELDDTSDATPVDVVEPGSDAAEPSPDAGALCIIDADCASANPCILGTCVQQVCISVARTGAPCDDANACTSGETCDSDGECQGGEEVFTGGSPCEVCSCDPVEGVTCAPALVGAECDDDDCCTLGDSCVECVAGEDPGCSDAGRMCAGSPLACDDGNDCSVDQCLCDDTGAGVCTYTSAADNLPCDFSENDCTVGDHCESGVCVVGTPAELDDQNPCTADTCVKGEVTHEPLLDGQCDDGNECTTGDTCYLGTCTGGEPVECLLPECASDAECVAGQGCVVDWMPAGAVCDDGDDCTLADVCDAAHVCQGGANACDDSDPCTTDSCGAADGCQNLPDAAQDGVPCTSQDGLCLSEGACLAGVCAPGALLTDCDDGSECTVDSCDPIEGCVHTPAECDDGDPCTVQDTCVAGVCVGTFSEEAATTVTCGQLNDIDSEFKCCCKAADPTGAYKSGHVLDMGPQQAETVMECCISPGFNAGCQDTAYIDVSWDGVEWTALESFPTSSVPKPEGGWESSCISLQPTEDFRYVRGANEKCYVDFFKCTLSCLE